MHDVIIRQAAAGDADDVLRLQKEAYSSEAELYQDRSLIVLHETTDKFLEALETHLVLVAIIGGRIVGSVRGRLDGDVCRIGRLFAAPGHQGRGIGTRLISAIENRFSTAQRFSLFTGYRSHGNIKLYQRLGYEITGRDRMTDKIEMVIMERPVHKADAGR